MTGRAGSGSRGWEEGEEKVEGMWKGELGAEELEKIPRKSKAAGKDVLVAQNWNLCRDGAALEAQQEGRKREKTREETTQNRTNFFPYFPSITCKRCPVSIPLVTATNSIRDRPVSVNSTPSWSQFYFNSPRVAADLLLGST